MNNVLQRRLNQPNDNLTRKGKVNTIRRGNITLGDKFLDGGCLIIVFP